MTSWEETHQRRVRSLSRALLFISEKKGSPAGDNNRARCTRSQETTYYIQRGSGKLELRLACQQGKLSDPCADTISTTIPCRCSDDKSWQD